MRPVGVGLVGLGRWGTNYARTLAQLTECRLVAAADPDPQAPGRAFVPAGGDPLAVIESAAVEAVVIATPDSTHARLAQAALAAGKDLMVEKPMALDPIEAGRLAALAASKGRVLAVGHTALYHPGFAELARSVRAGELGPVGRLTMARSSRGAPGASDVAFDLAPHDIAMAVALLGVPVAVRAHAGPTRRCRQAVAYQLQFAGDAVAAGWAAWSETLRVRRFRVIGMRASARFCDEGAAPAAVRDSALGRQCLDFLRCCRDRSQPQSDGRLGSAVVGCLAGIDRSRRTFGDWVAAAADAALAAA